ncbi:prephenate dehydrogenase [Paenibacillus baekrokdamisoli]|uniref:Prephenate dehydrogenase n=1 Tax=Paenibacillus baekrokdamisoli TaxID=1712516 RepID=A0A3G9JAV6_9BACL|nr:prephenate dehydrogenase [Paenibacillus baekrokdamisoli]MBB3069668.1 prephenate dehydrogenase [Paenibacillus baekrokdamisoli]BBH20978.1 prephenate dehydrogenase [Paenibacillus baekrokdamisoli]
MTKIAIFGVGLIGGSLALCFKGKPGLTVVGHSIRESSAAKYLERGVVDYATTSMREAAEGADFIFLCVPVGNLDQYVRELSSLQLKPGCIVTDVGSTKASVAASAKQVQLEGATFIGGHPMAGKEQSGVEAASVYLFENAFYVITPDPDTNQQEVDKLIELLKHTKAHIIQVSPEEHDEIVGAISHLPHIIAVALVNQIRAYSNTNELYCVLAAGGFRDITRIASSDPIVWRDILVDNRKVLLRLLKDWNEGTSTFIRMLEEQDGDRIELAFKEAGQFRGQLPERRKGMIHSIYECYVDVPDHPGIIGKVATELGNSSINLSNIQIIESREDVPGVLRLSFRTQEDLDRAVDKLDKIGYSVHF